MGIKITAMKRKDAPFTLRMDSGDNELRIHFDDEGRTAGCSYDDDMTLEECLKLFEGMVRHVKWEINMKGWSKPS